MREPAGGDIERRTAPDIPGWAIYLFAALTWPLLLQLLIVIPAAVFGLGGKRLATLSTVIVPVIVFLVTFWIGRGAARSGAPQRLWVVPLAWACVGAAFSLFGYLLSDVKDVLGVFGVVASYVGGALGFWLGIRGGGDKPEHVGEQSII